MRKVSYQLTNNYDWSNWYEEPNVVGKNNTKYHGLSFILPVNWIFRAHVAIGWSYWYVSGGRIYYGAINTYITNIELKNNCPDYSK